MKTLERPSPIGVRPVFRAVRGTEPAYQAYVALYIGYIALPVLAGADKFTHYLVDWDKYLSPRVADIMGTRVDSFMKTVGVVEIAAGLLVALSRSPASTTSPCATSAWPSGRSPSGANDRRRPSRLRSR